MLVELITTHSIKIHRIRSMPGAAWHSKMRNRFLLRGVHGGRAAPTNKGSDGNSTRTPDLAWESRRGCGNLKNE